MPRPLLVFVPLLGALAGVPALAQPAGQADLDRGREAVARQDYAAASGHLKRAVAALDPQRDRAAFADAWLQLGISHLLGGDPAEEALAAFLASAAAAPNPASAYLWAATAAERLGRREEAEIYKARALGTPPAAAPAPPAAPTPGAAVAPPPTAPPVVAPPVEAPAPAVVPTPEPPAEGKAFQHFFERREPAAAAPKPASPEAPPTKDQGDKEEKTPEAKPPSDGAAFDHFFRRRKGAPAPPPAADPDAAPAEEKPPAF